MKTTQSQKELMSIFLVTTLTTLLGLQLVDKLPETMLYKIRGLRLIPVSLSSTMLRRLRMSVDQALDTYKAFGNAVFGKPRWFHERSFLWYPRAKFSCRKTRAVFQEVVYQTLRRERDCLPSEAETEPLKYREDRTRT
jgi:hypothetical protein